MSHEEERVKRVIAKFGPVLDLRNRPQDLIDIIRTFQIDPVADDGGLPGGVPPQPPPGPTSMQPGLERMDEVMAELLRVSRQVNKSAQDIAAIKGQLGL